MRGNIVLIRHPKVHLNFRALRFEWEGRPYYAVPHNVGAGRFAFGEADGIEELETCEQVEITREYARAAVGFVEAVSFFEAQTALFLEPRREWFRNPDPIPVMLRTPGLEELRERGLI
jgi:hypothetical protein